METEMTAKEILETYNEITIEKVISNGIFLFSLFGKQFLFAAPMQDVPASHAEIFLFNDEGLDLPHIMFSEENFSDMKDWPTGKYRWICLYEHESVVFSLETFEEKVVDAISRLMKLLTMNEIERNREYRKEFMFYWNASSQESQKVYVYLSRDDSFSKMDVYYSEKGIRITEQGKYLSDIDGRNQKNKRKWVQHLENEAFFIPITDSRDILPPHRGYTWGSQEIVNILYPRQIEHISADTFQKIKTIVPKTQNLILVFGIRLDRVTVAFSVKIECKNGFGHTILEKVLGDLTAVKPIKTIRKDYLHLCQQIGNDVKMMKQKLLIVGAGSLGSYIILELVKNGVSNISVYDGDQLEEENVLRWAYGGIGIGGNKANVISLLSNSLNPGVNVKANAKNISQEELIKESSNADLIIFTIGSSDEQLGFNRALKKAGCLVPVIFVWLEAGGRDSHILVINYQNAGCFECLYTNDDGILVNNRAAKSDIVETDASIIRNGCGGTRAAYGSAVLLRTTAALLDVIKRIENREFTDNVLIDISPERIGISDIKFPQEECNCCGNKSIE